MVNEKIYRHEEDANFCFVRFLYGREVKESDKKGMGAREGKTGAVIAESIIGSSLFLEPFFFWGFHFVCL